MSDERLSVSLFLPSLAIGGAEKVLLNVSEVLADQNHDVEFVLVNAEGGFLDDVPSGVSITELGASRVLTATPGLIKHLRESDPDVLLSTTQPANVISLWATLTPGVTTRHIVRVARPESVAAVVENNTRKDRLTATLARWFYPFADDVVAISNGVADDVLENTRVDEKDLHIIYNPVVDDEMAEKADEPVDHPHFARDGDVILGVGRLVDQKGFPTLIRAFERLRKNRDMKLVIVGDGPLRTQLEELIAELGLENHVDLPGFSDNPYKYMKQADVFVNSAKHEGFGNVIVEAMACGTPVVATDCPGAPNEILDGGEFGELVPVGDEAKMAEGITRALDSKTNSESLIDRANDFHVEINTNKYADIVCDV